MALKFHTCGIRKSLRLLQTHPLQRFLQEASQGVNENHIYAPSPTKGGQHKYVYVQLTQLWWTLAVGYSAEQQHAQQQQQLFLTRHGSRWFAISVLHLACSNLQASDEYREPKGGPTSAPNVSQSRRGAVGEQGVPVGLRGGARYVLVNSNFIFGPIGTVGLLVSWSVRLVFVVH